MPRPFNPRRVGMVPVCTYYKPQGIPLRILQQVNLAVDEIEAVRLVDYNGLYQADAAAKMNISRQTIGRILESAHKKIADALVNGKALSIEGGNFEMTKLPDDIKTKTCGKQKGKAFGRCRRGSR